MSDKQQDNTVVNVYSQRPAIVITESVGHAEVVIEFATKEDYGYYKSLED